MFINMFFKIFADWAAKGPFLLGIRNYFSLKKGIFI